MAFGLSREDVLEVQVDARISGQQILNVFHYRSEEAPPGLEGVSDLFLLSFRNAYRTLMLDWMYDTYTVHRYWLRIIRNVVSKGVVPKHYYQNVYQFEYDQLDGTVLDVGALPSELIQMLPTNMCLRAYKNPAELRRGFQKSCYNRFASFGEPDYGTPGHDLWNDAFITNVNAQLDLFRTTQIFGFDPPVGNGWSLATWSPAYYFTRFGGADPVIATRTGSAEVRTFIADPYVGTQITRRYNPAGGFRGK